MRLDKLTLFDLDHTLIPIDSDYSWGEFTISLGWVNPVEFKRKNDAFYADYKNGTLDIEAYVRFSTAAMCEKGPEISNLAHAQYMVDVIKPVVCPQAVALVCRHKLPAIQRSSSRRPTSSSRGRLPESLVSIN